MSAFDDYKGKYENIACRRKDGVLEARLHSHGESLVMSDTVHRDLGPFFQDVAADYDNRVVVLTGTGGAFCSKFDHGSFSDRSPDVHEWALRIRRDGRRMLSAFLDIEVPVIAAINGPCVSHSELPLLADVVLCADTTVFQDATHFIRGLPPGDGMHVVWTTLLGLNRGRYFLLTGERIAAQRALELGVVGEVLPPDRLLDRAWELARAWAKLPLTTLVGTRQVLTYEWRRLLLQQLHNGLTEEAAHLVTTAPGAARRPPIADLL